MLRCPLPQTKGIKNKHFSCSRKPLWKHLEAVRQLWESCKAGKFQKFSELQAKSRRKYAGISYNFKGTRYLQTGWDEKFSSFQDKKQCEILKIEKCSEGLLRSSSCIHNQAISFKLENEKGFQFPKILGLGSMYGNRHIEVLLGPRKRD